jgi:Cyclin, N-terminal domain
LKGQICLLLAAKYDELDDRIPLIREIQKLARYEFSYKDCKAEEEVVLFALDWSLIVVTPLHLIQTLLSMGVVFEDEVTRSSNSVMITDID